MNKAELKFLDILLDATVKPKIQHMQERIEQLEEENTYLRRQNERLTEKLTDK